MRPQCEGEVIQGAKSAVMTTNKRDDPISKWLYPLREKCGWQTAAVAMVNKNACILWASVTLDYLRNLMLCNSVFDTVGGAIVQSDPLLRALQPMTLWKSVTMKKVVINLTTW